MFELWSRRMFSFILSALFAASVFAVPQIVNAGGPGIEVPVTDDTSDRLVGYWDLRDRETFFQITNTSGAAVDIHLQFFDATGDCAEFDYMDSLTPRDTHVYNVRDLDRNNGVALEAPDLTDGHGVVAVSVSPQGEGDDVLTGNFRIVDDAGYEYRTNLAGEGRSSDEDDWHFNFNNVDGSTFADLVFILYGTDGDSDEIETVSRFVQPTLFDADENPISCPPIQLGCGFEIGESMDPPSGPLGTTMNVGINQAVTNSRGGPSLCLGNDTTGHIELELIGRSTEFDEGAIFLGLNNGSSTGSIDHAFAD